MKRRKIFRGIALRLGAAVVGAGLGLCALLSEYPESQHKSTNPNYSLTQPFPLPSLDRAYHIEKNLLNYTATGAVAAYSLLELSSLIKRRTRKRFRVNDSI